MQHYELNIEHEYGDHLVVLSAVSESGSMTYEGRGESLADAFRELASELERNRDETEAT